MRRAVESRVVRAAATAPSCPAPTLEKLLQRLIAATSKLLQQVERRGHPRDIVEALLDRGARDRDSSTDRERLEDLAADADHADARRSRGRRDEEHNRCQLRDRRPHERLLRGPTRSASTS